MRALVLILTILFFVGCESTDYPGYKRVDESLHYKLAAVGDESVPVCEKCFVTLELQVFNATEKPVAIKRFDRVEFGTLSLSEPIVSQLLKGSEGDSILFKGTVADFNTNDWMSPISFDSSSQVLQINLKVDEVLTAEELVSKRADERMMKDLEMQGARWMSLAVDSLKFLEEESQNGIYYRELEAGDGEFAKSGEFLTVHYIAKLPNGELVDNTYIGNPLEFEVGRPDQVLKGFAIGISKMKKGSKSLMLIPSNLAFGEKGSTEGIVPPYAPIIYEVELVDVGE